MRAAAETEKARWERETLAPALEQSPERARVFTTISGRVVERLYSAEDAAGIDTGRPGEFPYTRGIHASGYRGKLWTMRQFAGFGTPEDTNARYQTLLLCIALFHDRFQGSYLILALLVFSLTFPGQAPNASGVGTLSGSAGAGTLSATINTGSDYQCKFDAQICGALTTINQPNPPGGTCLGLQHQNKVTPTLAGDEGGAVTNVGNTLTENVCFTHLEGSTVP